MHSYDRRQASTRRTAAVDKVPLFSKFDRKISLEEIEQLFAKHYDVVPGSCRFDGTWQHGHNDVYINVRCDSTLGEVLWGSVVMKCEVHGPALRAMAYVNIDG